MEWICAFVLAYAQSRFFHDLDEILSLTAKYCKVQEHCKDCKFLDGYSRENSAVFVYYIGTADQLMNLLFTGQ